jgi:hypothetical protein
MPVRCSDCSTPAPFVRACIEPGAQVRTDGSAAYRSLSGLGYDHQRTVMPIFVVVSFTGRVDSKHPAEVAPRVGMHGDDLSAIAPRIAAQSGATVGTSRRVVYLLA